MPARFIPRPLLNLFGTYRPAGRPPRSIGTPRHLSDGMLKDIGLTRSDIESPGRKW